MMPLLLGVLAASLLGSLHCAGMCGAFLAIATGDPAAPKFRTQAAYHAGRLMTYVTLGTLAGFAGRTLNLAGSLTGIQHTAATLAALTMLAFGLVTLARISGWQLGRLPIPPALRSLSKSGLNTAMRFNGPTRAWVIGLSTTLLPCGWLYAFVAVAAGTASPWRGAAAMAVFWTGTLPVMVAMATGLRALTGPLSRHVPAATCLLLISLSTFTLLGRLQLSPVSLLAHTSPALLNSGAASPKPSLPSCCTPSEAK
jgi:uncharacterized protein